MSSHPVGGFGTEVGVPAPPPGPGVAPPFVAPPTDRSKRGLLIGLGVGGLVLLLCCVGGLFGLGVIVIGGTEQAKRQATAVVTVYLDALREGDYGTAHEQYCDRLAKRVTVDQLAAETRREPFTSYRLDDPRIASFVEVTAHLGTVGSEVARTYLLESAGQELKICDIR